MRRHAIRLVSVAAVVAVMSGCSLESLSQSSGVVNVVVGYQSKTINTVTAGTLLRVQGYLERRLADITTRTGTKYAVRWQDYDTDAPITAQMLAEKIDIGSMGDYPLPINGSKTRSNPLARTEMVSVAGYNPKGALNMVVVAPDSSATALADLAGTKVSASVGSAGHGTLVRALNKAGINGVEVLNQQPQVGVSALESDQVQALSQFVAWPGLLVYQGKAKLLYDGAELNVPTLHGVVVRRTYASAHPEVLAAFLQAQLDATDFLNEKPLEAARVVAQASGLPQEVVYLYNGPGGTSFDTTLKPSLADALKSDVPYLKSIGDFADLDIGGFVSDEPLPGGPCRRTTGCPAPRWERRPPGLWRRGWSHPGRLAAPLDTQTRAAMQRLLIDTWRAHPTTIVFVTHDVDEAPALGDRIVVLGRAGQPLRASFDVPDPRSDRPTGELRAEIIAALDHSVAA